MIYFHSARGRQKGITLLEFAVVAVVLGIFAAVLLDRLSYYQEAVEKVKMEATANALRSALRMEMANTLMTGKRMDFDLLIGSNPISWLEKKPANYLGEYDSADADRLQGAGWYFDRGRRELVYRVDLGGHFRPDSSGRKRVRFAVRPVGGGQNGAPGVATVNLVVLESYRWF